MTLLYLIRHGRSVWNAENRMQGQADPPLDDVGREQARALAERLKGETFNAIYSSPLLRAKETTEIAFASHTLRGPIKFDDRLMERHLGEWTGLTWDEIEGRYPASGHGQWRIVGPPGGEGQAALVARAAAVFEAIRAAQPAGPVAVVSHGGLLSAGLVYFLGAPPDKYISFSFPNTGLARVMVRDGHVRVLGLDDHHLW